MVMEHTNATNQLTENGARGIRAKRRKASGAHTPMTLKIYTSAHSVNASLRAGREVFATLEQSSGTRVRITAYKVTMRGCKGPWGRQAGTGRWVPVKDIEVGPAAEVKQ
jgi:hypothetical protein